MFKPPYVKFMGSTLPIAARSPPSKRKPRQSGAANSIWVTGDGFPSRCTRHYGLSSRSASQFGMRRRSSSAGTAPHEDADRHLDGEKVKATLPRALDSEHAAAMTQSVAITCAQIATIPKNNASEASAA